MTTPRTYVYDAVLLPGGVHDGDTVNVAARLRRVGGRRTFALDLGFHTFIEVDGWLTTHASIRLLGIQAPELSQPDGSGLRSRDFLRQQVSDGEVLTLQSFKPTHYVDPDKYGNRWDGVLLTKGATPVNLNDLMMSSGHAVAWTGDGPKPSGE